MFQEAERIQVSSVSLSVFREVADSYAASTRAALRALPCKFHHRRGREERLLSPLLPPLSFYRISKSIDDFASEGDINIKMLACLRGLGNAPKTKVIFRECN